MGNFDVEAKPATIGIFKRIAARCQPARQGQAEKAPGRTMTRSLPPSTTMASATDTGPNRSQIIQLFTATTCQPGEAVTQVSS